MSDEEFSDEGNLVVVTSIALTGAIAVATTLLTDRMRTASADELAALKARVTHQVKSIDVSGAEDKVEVDGLNAALAVIEAIWAEAQSNIDRSKG